MRLPAIQEGGGMKARGRKSTGRTSASKTLGLFYGVGWQAILKIDLNWLLKLGETERRVILGVKW